MDKFKSLSLQKPKLWQPVKNMRIMLKNKHLNKLASFHFEYKVVFKCL